MALVVQMDVALVNVSKDDVRSEFVESSLASTRGFLASIAQQHPAFFFEGPGLRIYEWLFFSMVRTEQSGKVEMVAITKHALGSPTHLGY